MGTRIHKVLGYALTDVEGELADERFNPSFVENGIYQAHSKELCQWILKNEDEALGVIKEFNCSDHRDLSLLKLGIKEQKIHDNLFIYDSEYALPNVFLICPPEFIDWYRYDDIIDYYDDDRGSNLEPSVKEVECGIFPHTMMLRIPGSPDFQGSFKHFNYDKKPKYINPATFQQLTGRWSDTVQAPDEDLKNYLLLQNNKH